MESAPRYEIDRSTADELIVIGKESYFIVSQFNVFEFEKEAPLFARLAECLDRCVLGLAMIRDRRLLTSGQSGGSTPKPHC